MDKAIDAIVRVLGGNGISGVFILALIVAIVFLWREMRQDSRAIIKLAAENTAALNLLTDVIKSNEAKREQLLAGIVALGVDIRSVAARDDRGADLWKERFDLLVRGIDRNGDSVEQLLKVAAQCKEQFDRRWRDP